MKLKTLVWKSFSANEQSIIFQTIIKSSLKMVKILHVTLRAFSKAGSPFFKGLRFALYAPQGHCQWPKRKNKKKMIDFLANLVFLGPPQKQTTIFAGDLTLLKRFAKNRLFSTMAYYMKAKILWESQDHPNDKNHNIHFLGFQFWELERLFDISNSW